MSFVEKMAAAFQDELEKIAESKTGVGLKGAVGVAAGGALGYEWLRRANHDRKLGKQMRIGQQGQY